MAVLHDSDEPLEHLAYIVEIETVDWPEWLSGTGADLPSRDVLYVAKEFMLKEMQDRERNTTNIAKVYTAIFESQLRSSDYPNKEDCKQMLDAIYEAEKVVGFHINTPLRTSNVIHTISYIYNWGDQITTFLVRPEDGVSKP